MTGPIEKLLVHLAQYCLFIVGLLLMGVGIIVGAISESEWFVRIPFGILLAVFGGICFIFVRRLNRH